MFGNFGLPEIGVILLFGLIIFGPDRLPKMASEAAKLIARFRGMSDTAMSELKAQLGPEFDNVDLRSLNPKRLVEDAVREHVFGENRLGDAPEPTEGKSAGRSRAAAKPRRTSTAATKRAATAKKQPAAKRSSATSTASKKSVATKTPAARTSAAKSSGAKPKITRSTGGRVTAKPAAGARSGASKSPAIKTPAVKAAVTKKPATSRRAAKPATAASEAPRERVPVG